jgi:hypothetical protein
MCSSPRRPQILVTDQYIIPLVQRNTSLAYFNTNQLTRNKWPLRSRLINPISGPSLCFRTCHDPTTKIMVTSYSSQVLSLWDRSSCFERCQRQAVLWLKKLFAGLSPRWPGFASGSVYVGFVVDKEALGQSFHRVLRFCTVNIIPTFEQNNKFKNKRKERFFLFSFTVTYFCSLL